MNLNFSRVVVLGASWTLVSACASGANAGGPAAVAGCDGPGLTMARAYGADARVSGAHSISAGQLVAWDERVRKLPGSPKINNSSWRSRPPNEQMAFCYYDGTFTNLDQRGAPARPPGPSQAPFDRIIVVVDGAGKATLLGAGPSSTLQMEDPTKP